MADPTDANVSQILTPEFIQHAVFENHRIHYMLSNQDPHGLRYLAGEQPGYTGPLQFPRKGHMTVAWDFDDPTWNARGAITEVNVNREFIFHNPVNIGDGAIPVPGLPEPEPPQPPIEE